MAVTAKRRPTRKEIAFYYKTHRSKFLAPEQRHVFQIIKNVDGITGVEEAARTMEAALAELAAGAEFGSVADRCSDCAGSGGDLGWVGRGVMVEEFEDVVFAIPLGQMSPVFESRFGLHIVLVTEERKPGILPMASVYEQIAEILSR